MITRNYYRYPIDLVDRSIMDKTSSPAHNGLLKNAVDFIVPEGTAIKAANKGVIMDIKQDSNIGGNEKEFDKFGNYIEIKHDNEEYSIYEHIKIKSVLVKIGDQVKEGQIIGYSGNTGWMGGLGPHLHFDVHKYFSKGINDYETLEIKWKRKSSKRINKSQL